MEAVSGDSCWSKITSLGGDGIRRDWSKTCSTSRTGTSPTSSLITRLALNEWALLPELLENARLLECCCTNSGHLLLDTVQPYVPV